MSLFSVPGKTMSITGAVFTLPQGKCSHGCPPPTLHSPRTLISSCMERLPHWGEGAAELGQAPPWNSRLQVEYF